MLNYFTWKQVADLVASVYEDVLRQHTMNERRVTNHAGRKRRSAEVVSLTPARRWAERKLAQRAAAAQRAAGSLDYRSARAVFIEKDELLIENLHAGSAADRLLLVDNAALGLRMLQAYGFKLIVVSHQPDIAHGQISEAAFAEIIARTSDLLARADVQLDGFYYCPHHPNATVPAYAVECSCRKPQPGLLASAAAAHCFDLSQSWMIGKILDDVEAGKRAQCRSLLLTRQSESAWKFMRPMRRPDYVAANIDQAAHVILDLDAQYSDAPILLASGPPTA